MNIASSIVPLLLASIIVAPARASHSESKDKCGPCSDCPNPLAEVRGIRFGGDLGDLPDTSDFYGWKDARAGKHQSDLPSQYFRGMDYLIWRDKNPCADVYYNIEGLDGSRIRVGPKRGEAKYAIESEILLVRKSEGEHTVVKYLIGQQTALTEPITITREDTGISYTTRYDWKEISVRNELIPLLGEIQLTHKLIAQKNNQVYDEGDSTIDWVADPPSEIPPTYEPGQSWRTHEYFRTDAPVEHGGKVFTPTDGLIVGDFSPSALTSLELAFDGRDIGMTCPFAWNTSWKPTASMNATMIPLWNPATSS